MPTYYLKRIFLIVALLLCGTVALAEALKLPDTGQTKCYKTVSPYSVILCAGTGQDGDYNINPMSFTNNGNGTVTDNITGLMWQKGENASTYNWYEASGTYDVTYNPTSQDVCGSLVLGNYSDWRLPSKKELLTIVDYSIPYPGPTIMTDYFPDIHAFGYWSSTTYAYNPSYAWFVPFYDGYVNAYGKLYKYDNYVRCVRGGQETPSLTDNGNGTVTDNRTGLIWQQGEPGYMTWGPALSYCEGLTLGGDSGWRLPNVKELESLSDDSKYNPTIDAKYFPDVSASYYWSSTTYAFNTGYAWYANFYKGYVANYDKEYGIYMNVRCVLGGQYRSSDKCASTLSSSDLSIHVPVMDFAGYYYWVDFVHVTGRDFTIVNVGDVLDLGPYNACAHATLSETTLGIHIPNIIFDDTSYWADFAYKEGLTVTLVNYGRN